MLEVLAVTVILAVTLAGTFALWPAARDRAAMSSWTTDTAEVIQMVRETYGDDFNYNDIPTNSGYVHLLPDSYRTGTAAHSPGGGALTIRRGGSGAIPGYSTGESFEIILRGYTPEQCSRFARSISDHAKRMFINGHTVKNYRQPLMSNYATRCSRSQNYIIVRTS